MSLQKNVIANYLGQGWTALMGIAFVPLYIHALGEETFGLIGVFIVLQALITLLDLGLTPTLNREMARLRAGAHTAESIRDLLRSLELIYVALAVVMIAVIWLGSSWLANGWLRAEYISPALVILSIKIMAFVLATRWCEQVYRGALQGMQDQVWLNGVQAVLATLRWGGAYVVVTYIWPSIIAFFVWQGCISVLTAIILVYRTYRILPASARMARFSVPALREIYGFASGMFLVALLSLLLTQADKLVISKLLPLTQLGYYMLAATVASGLLQLITPMNTAVYPKFTEQVARNDLDGLALTYQHSCEWMSAIIIPPALLLTFFAAPVLLAWTGDIQLAQSVSALLALLSLGTLFNGLMNLPYMLQLAYGWTSLTIKVNIVAVVLIVPTIIWAVPRYGAVGAACAWLALNAAYLVLTAQLMYRRILPAAKWPWYRKAIVAPLLAGSLTGAALLAVLPVPSSRIAAAFTVLLAGLCLTVAVVCALPNVRVRLMLVLSATFRFRTR